MAEMVHGTLVADTVTTVTLAGNHGTVEILNRSTAEIWFTLDSATDPTVGGANVWVLPAGAARELPSPSSAITQVRLISSAAAAYSVTGL